MSREQVQSRLANIRPGVGRLLDLAFRDDTPLRELSERYGARVFGMPDYMSPEQYRWLSKAIPKYALQSVVLTGFHAGLAAFAFASFGAERVTIFDTGGNDCVSEAQNFLRKRYRDTKFELVLGNPAETIPTYKGFRQHTLAYVDGERTESAAFGELDSLRGLTEPGAFVVMDDYVSDPLKHPRQSGPTVAYDRAVNEGIVEHVIIGRPGKTGWAQGEYAL